MRAFDKLGEAKYHLDRLKEIYLSLNNTKISERTTKIIWLRYELNSFINATRSVTFAIQKDLKSIHGDEFIKWYEESRIPLKENKFANLLKELRNVIQKEGNALPRFILCSVLNEKEKFQLDIDYSAVVNGKYTFKAIINFKATKIKYNLSDDEETKNRKIAQQLVDYFVTKVKFEGRTFFLESIILDESGTTMKIKDFLDSCDSYYKTLYELVESAEKRFK